MTAQKVLTVNIEQAERIIALCWKAQTIAKKNGIPVTTGVALVGPTMTGKSSVVRKVVEKLGPEYRYWMAALATLMDSGDLGTPVPDVKEKLMRYFTAGHWPFNIADAKGIFAFEELDRCPVELQRGAAHIMLERELHGMTLADGVFCVATMNGTSDSYTEELSEHIRTRFVSIFITRDAAGGADAYDAWAAERGLSVTRRAFNRYCGDTIPAAHEFSELAVCGNRTLDMADCILQASRVVKFKTDDVLMPAIAGCIGVGAAARYMATDKLVSEAPDPEECIANPTIAKIPVEVSTMYALALAIAGAVSDTTDRSRLSGAAIYLSRMQPALAAVAFKTVSDKNPRIWTTKEALGWQNEHKALLL
jgi:hypothetical protein